MDVVVISSLLISVNTLKNVSYKHFKGWDVKSFPR